MSEATIKDKPEKKSKDNKEKPLPLSQISVTSDGDFLIIKMPKKLAVKQLLNG